jgi:hypothetical protein
VYAQYNNMIIKKREKIPNELISWWKKRIYVFHKFPEHTDTLVQGLQVESLARKDRLFTMEKF